MMTHNGSPRACALLLAGLLLFGGGSTTVWGQGAPPEEVPPGSAAGDPDPSVEAPDGPPVAPKDPGQPGPGEPPRPRAQTLDDETRSALPPPREVRATGSHGAPEDATPRGGAWSPVVRAQAGNWGMFFKLGGLADLRHGNTSRNVNGLVLTQTGFRAVINERLIIPITFGAGFRVLKAIPPQENNRGDWGLDLGVGLEWHFRVWRRISPFIAFHMALAVLDRSGEKNTILGLGMGPSLGVEYYIGDRVSLSVSYILNFQFEFMKMQDGPGAQAVQITTVAGGALNISYYF